MRKEVEEALKDLRYIAENITPKQWEKFTASIERIRKTLTTDNTLEIVKINKERMVRENIMNNIPIPDALSFANEIISESEEIE